MHFPNTTELDTSSITHLSNSPLRKNRLARAIMLALFSSSVLPVVTFAEQPDLSVTSVTTTELSTDLQSLQVRGNVQVKINNVGTSQAEPALVTLFEDSNLNGLFDDEADNVVGSVSMSSSLPADVEKTLNVPITGKVAFRDSPINAMVDSDQRINEAREDNNLDSSASMCEFESDIGRFEPLLKWEWSGSSVLSQYNQVMSLPIVAPLEDTNDDGKINQLDTPSVIFHTFRGGNYRADGVLRAVSGKEGHELWTVSDPSYRTLPAGSLAAADIDNDGFVEIIAPKTGGGSDRF